MSKPETNTAILFEPEGYRLTGSNLMGRQAAGNGFLRAAVAGRGELPLISYTPHKTSAKAFGEMVKALDADAPVEWIPSNRPDLLANVGTLYLPGPGLESYARLRLRVGCAAYSLVGVTHTTATHRTMDSFVGLFSAPVMPWDALVCTSTAVGATVKTVLEAEVEYLRWRYGSSIKLTLPQLPAIPLGVHCKDFEFSVEERNAARETLGIGSNDVVVLYVGRLDARVKAHPHAMYAGLQSAVERTGKNVVLIQCGWFSNKEAEESFTDGVARFSPSVRAMFTEGRDEVVRRQSWAAADVFVSLSDNIQETFGLTPIEAMAAGLPVVVTDWNGYKDTVRQGVDGFRIPTWMPSPGPGNAFALPHEAGTLHYGSYCSLTSYTVAVDGALLAERLGDLISDANLRRRLGEAGQKRAREVFDWAVIYRQYKTLYGQLAEQRSAAVEGGDWKLPLASAPKSAASRMDPYLSFGHYPSALIQATTIVVLAPNGSYEAYRQLAQHELFRYGVRMLLNDDYVAHFLIGLSEGALRVQELAEQNSIDLGTALMTLSVLAKMGLVSFSATNTEINNSQRHE
ncbi:MAG: glycosyltransferase family 4 protein [Sulfuritalea sp.]|nr:glycosyltransferase family 4 protein [Sulfuritalea sp.]